MLNRPATINVATKEKCLSACKVEMSQPAQEDEIAAPPQVWFEPILSDAALRVKAGYLFAE